MAKKINIYLADLANNFFICSPSTIPLQIGYIKAYAMSQLTGQIEIKLFRDFESLYRQICSQPPDFLGCSWYGWNRYLTVNALKYIKSRYPDIITVLGGANVSEKSENCLRDFYDFPWVDFMVPNEGEISFLNLIKKFINCGKEKIFESVIDGVFYLSRKQKDTLEGELLPVAEDINIFPSPYLSGDLDCFLLNKDLMPIIQSVRGCPFRCSFCVSAKDSCKKIRFFDVKRVKMEIEYLARKAKNRTIRFADDNFGIVESDLELAKFIAETRLKTGYPNGLRVYTHKEINKNIKEIVLLLKDLIPLNISTQSLTEDVLVNVGRKNLSMDKLSESISWAHANNIIATTEVIFGLPGESYSSFIETINKLVSLRFDSVSSGTLTMLKETKVNSPETIKEYEYKILYGIAENGYTKFNDFENIEIDAWAVESKDFTFDEFIKMNIILNIFELFMFWGYFKELVYLCENRGVRIVDIILELLNDSARYPLFFKQTQRLKKCLKENLFKTKEEARSFFGKKLFLNSDQNQHIGFMNHYIVSQIIKGEMICYDNQEEAINEVINASLETFNKSGGKDKLKFLEELSFIKVLIKNIIIPFWEFPEERVFLNSPYDLVAWRNCDYRFPLANFKLKKRTDYVFRVRSIGQYVDFVKKNSDKPFHLQSELFFRSFRSNNVRRFLE